MRAAVILFLAASTAFGQPAQPRPLLIDGKPVRAPALLERGIVLATRAEDGTWRDPDDFTALDRSTLLAESKSKPLKLRKEWIHLANATYRGKEGFQSLRWGMTKAEALRSLGDVTLVPTAALMQLAFRTTSEGRTVTVQCTFASDRLATISVHFEAMTFDAASALYQTRFGTPFSENETRRLWLTPETEIVLWGDEKAPVLLLFSKAFSRIAADQMMNRGQRAH